MIRQVKSELMLINLCVPLLGALFYATGSFGFLNIFGVRREVQTFIIIFLLFFGLLVFKRLFFLLKEPVFLAACLFFLWELILRHEYIYLMDRFLSILVVGLVFSISERQGSNVLRIIVVLASVFSLMAILQAFLLWFNLALLPYIAVGYSSESQAAFLAVEHSIGYLGFALNSTINVGGYEFARLQSFAAEPSVLVYSFLMPGILALSFQGAIRFLAIPILLFSVVIAASGTIWLSVALGFASWPLFYIVRRQRLLSFMPYLVIIIFFVFVAIKDVREITLRLVDVLNPLATHYSALSKETSAISRFTDILESLSNVKLYLFGAPFHITSSIGLLMSAYLSAGIIGLVLMLIIFYRIFNLSVMAYKRGNLRIKIMVLLLYGTMIQVLSFSAYGWTGISGFMALSLITLRLNSLSDRTPRASEISMPQSLKVHPIDETLS